MSPLAAIAAYWPAFASGLMVTVALTMTAVVAGTVIGVGLAVLISGRGRQALNTIALGVAAIPALVVLFWLYYPAQTILGVLWSPFTTAVLALGLMNSFAVYRTTQDTLAEFPQQYVSAALVCGLTSTQIALSIKAPLLIRAGIGRWLDQQVVILQTSVFASLIGVDEIFRAAQRINSVVYQPVVIYTAMALVFVTTAGPAIYAARVLKARFQRDFSEH